MVAKFECIVSAELVRRAGFGASTDETRYYLQGIHISPAPQGGAVITATDGHLLISLHDPDGIVSGEAIVKPNKQLAAALKSPRRALGQRLLLVRCEGGAGRAFVAEVHRGKDDEGSAHVAAMELFDAPDGRVHAAQFGAVAIDGTYPDWRRIVPVKLSPTTATAPIDQRLLARIASAITSDGNTALRLTATGDTPAADPILVTAERPPSGVTGLAIVMPVRSASDKPPIIPAWIAAPVLAAAE